MWEEDSNTYGASLRRAIKKETKTDYTSEVSLERGGDPVRSFLNRNCFFLDCLDLCGVCRFLDSSFYQACLLL